MWRAWWRLETPGRALAALQYLSYFIYAFDEPDPAFALCLPEGRWSGPSLWGHGSLFLREEWLPENIGFLAKTLTPEFVEANLPRVSAALAGELESAVACRVLDDLPDRRGLVASRLAELPTLLATDRHEGFSV